VGIKRVGDTGALGWIAEQLDVVRLTGRAARPASPQSNSNVRNSPSHARR
jgi:hypothetical protein